MTLKQRKIAFIGGGHITNIIIENLTRTETATPEQLIVSDPNKKRLETLQSQFAELIESNLHGCLLTIGKQISRNEEPP